MEGARKYVPPSGSQHPTVPQLRRMKFGWRALLICNFALGAYLFTLPKNKGSHEQKRSGAEEAPSFPIETTVQYEEPVYSPPSSDSAGMQQQSATKHHERDFLGWLKRR